MWAGLFFFMPLFRGLITPLVRAFILGVYLYTPRPIAGLVGLYRGIVEGAIYWGLFLCLLSRVPAPAVVRVRSCWALLRACPCPCGCPPLVEGLHLAPVSLGYISLTAAGACVNRVSPWACGTGSTISPPY